MRLHAHAYVLTGDELFDYSLGATQVWQDRPEGPLLFTSSGLYGGMSSWQIAPNGDLTLLSVEEFPGTRMAVARDQIVVAESRGAMWAFHGRDPQHFVGFEIARDGTLAQHRRTGFERVSNGIAENDTGLLEVWSYLHDIAPVAGYGASDGWLDTRGIAVLPDGTALMVSAQSNALHRITPSGNVQSFGAELGFSTPTGLAVLPDMGAGQRVVISGSQSASLSVLRAEGNGFVASDHLVDTTHTALYRAQALSTAQVSTANGPLDLVLAGGANHGISLFAATPQGQLVWLDTFFDTAETALYNLASLQTVAQPERLMVIATSESAPGISVLHLPLATLGGLVFDGRGGARDDILIASADATRLTGGAGEDIFVVPSLGARVTITDFEPGQDRIDLSDWPMLRDLSQLSITPRADGAMIEYRDHSLRVHSATGTRLDAETLFPTGLQGADRVLPREFPLSELGLPQLSECNIMGLRGRVASELAAHVPRPALSTVLSERTAPLESPARSASASDSQAEKLLTMMLAESDASIALPWQAAASSATAKSTPPNATKLLQDMIADLSNPDETLYAAPPQAASAAPEMTSQALHWVPANLAPDDILPGTGFDWL